MTSYTVAPLGTGTGAMVQAPAGTSLDALDRDALLGLLAAAGHVLLRGFGPGPDDFSTLVGRCSSRTTLDPARTFYDAVVQKVDGGTHALPLHSENSTTPFSPDVIWFHCATAARHGSQTTVADGRRIWAGLSDRARAAFAAQEVVFARSVPEHIWKGMVHHLSGGRIALADVEFRHLRDGLAASAAVRLEPRDDAGVWYAFTTPAVHPTRFAADPAFCNSLLTLGSDVYELPTITFADGTPIPADIDAEVRAVSAAVTEEIDWQDGDILVVDNTRVMHGRREILDEARNLFNAQSYVTRRWTTTDGVVHSDRWTVAALSPMPEPVLRQMFGQLPVDVVVPASRDAAGLHAVLADADIVLGDFSGQLRLDAAAIAAAPRLAFVQQPSAGVDSLDVPALTAAGIPVANVGPANAISVAEWALGGTLSVLRSLPWADAAVRAGGWPQLEVAARPSLELSGRRVGIVGFGAVGAACASRYAALGCPVSYWSRRQRSEDEAAGAQYRELDDLVSTSDVLVVAIAKTAGTVGLLNAGRLGRLPRGAVVVNVARGGILDEDALLAGITEGRLHGAALDVFARTPLPAGSPLRGSDRILLSPAVGGGTAQAMGRVVATCVRNLAAAVAGDPVAHLVNDAPPQVRRRVAAPAEAAGRAAAGPAEPPAQPAAA
jgi:D-3-phosphoglycerate dehydrogenase